MEKQKNVTISMSKPLFVIVLGTYILMIAIFISVIGRYLWARTQMYEAQAEFIVGFDSIDDAHVKSYTDLFDLHNIEYYIAASESDSKKFSLYIHVKDEDRINEILSDAILSDTESNVQNKNRDSIDE